MFKKFLVSSAIVLGLSVPGISQAETLTRDQVTTLCQNASSIIIFEDGPGYLFEVLIGMTQGISPEETADRTRARILEGLDEKSPMNQALSIWLASDGVDALSMYSNIQVFEANQAQLVFGLIRSCKEHFEEFIE